MRMEISIIGFTQRASDKNSKYPPGLYLIIMLVSLGGWGCEPVEDAAPHDPFAQVKKTSPPHTTELVDVAGQILQDALTSPQARLRSTGAEIVGSTRQLRFLPTVRQLMRDPIVPVRFAAILAAGDTRYTPAQRDLLQIYQETDEDFNVRMAAAYALGRMGVQDITTFYTQQINNPDQTIRANAALLIGIGGHREALNLLYWALQDAKSQDRVHMQAAESIARLKDERIIEKLWTRLISGYIDDRIDGIRAMGALSTQSALEAIQTMLDDPEFEVRLAAAEELGRIGDHSGEEAVLASLKRFLRALPGNDPEQTIRIKAMSAAAIGTIGTDPLTHYLPQLLEDNSPIVRLAAARAVFNIQKRLPNPAASQFRKKDR